jgi:hypothetical protein
MMAGANTDYHFSKQATAQRTRSRTQQGRCFVALIQYYYSRLKKKKVFLTPN